jgi:hypothetical protein
MYSSAILGARAPCLALTNTSAFVYAFRIIVFMNAVAELWQQRKHGSVMCNWRATETDPGLSGRRVSMAMQTD